MLYGAGGHPRRAAGDRSPRWRWQSGADGMVEGQAAMGSHVHGEGEREQAGAPVAAEDLDLVAALRRGEEAAFAVLLGQYHESMVRLALLYVGEQAVAEEAVQETWVAVLEGVGRFEARS